MFLLGVSTGIYFGTYYNFRPVLDQLSTCIKNKLPAKREEEHNSYK